MATVAQLIEAVSAVTMVEHKTVNAYGRALIDGGMLPISRGRAVAHIEGEHASNLLVAMALQPLIRTSALMVDLYNKLEAKTSSGRVVAGKCLADLFGAASAGGLTDEWEDVEVIFYENRPGIDLQLPHGKGTLEFRVARIDDFDPLTKFMKLQPNPFFTRQARVPFSTIVFLCQIMAARNEIGHQQGRDCVTRIEALRPV